MERSPSYDKTASSETLLAKSNDLESGRDGQPKPNSSSYHQPLKRYKPSLLYLLFTFLFPIFLGVLVLIIFLCAYACTPTDFGWSLCPHNMVINDVYYEFDRENPPPPIWKLVFIPGFVFGFLFFFCSWGMYVGGHQEAGRRLGMRHPMSKRERKHATKERERKKGKSGVIADLRRGDVRCEVVGKAWKYDEDNDKGFVGKHFQEFGFERCEDCSEEWELEGFLEEGNFQEITAKVSDLNANFSTNFRTLIPVEESQQPVHKVSSQSENTESTSQTSDEPGSSTNNDGPQPEYATETELTATVLDPLPRPESDSPTYIDEKILFVYRGAERPWWTSRMWYRMWFWLCLGGFWEVWVGSGYKEVEKGVVIDKGIY
ncbi:hypothetical protein HDV00_006790 [Rhizophlyctis rosea]|nr:hypothetical protein HDV00_006790 [Rhizophlyctis rosea]